MERRSTVHFDDEEPAPNEAPKPSTPVEAKSLNNTKMSAHGSNRSASQSSTREVTTPEATTKPTQSSLKVYNTKELTAVDKKWGRLFEMDNQPTERFREVMHSLSRYIIGAFPSSENIVLVPAKLASFYNFHSVDSDPFCYKLIFQSGERDLNRRVAELYQDLGCSYHLVQASPGLQPRVPGLTPDGFTRWMALHLQAFPDGVSQRLDRVISDFPLDAVSPLDGRTERLPKQLSRYLLPRVPDGRIRSLLQQAVKRHFGESALLAFSFPDEKSGRPAPYTSQSCPSSPSSRSLPLPSSPSASTPTVFQAGYRDSHGHRASDPGTVSHTSEEKVVPPTHRRHASYPGSQSGSRRSSSELLHDRRESREYDRDREREREDRRHRSPSRPRSSRHQSSSRHDSPAVAASTERKEEVVRRSHSSRQHSLRGEEKHHHRSESHDSRRRSSSRSSYADLPTRSSSCLVTGSSNTSSSSSSSSRNKYPPSPLSTVHPSSRSRSRSTTPASRDGSRPPATAATATNTSARRAPSPKIHHSARASLPEIHYTDRRWQSSVMRDGDRDLARDAMEHSAEINRRASYYGPPPALAMAEEEARRAKAREHGPGHRMKRRASSGEEQNYRLYGSPVSRESEAKPVVHTQIKTDVSSTPRSSSSSSPRVYPTRPPVSLAATVTSLEDEQARLVNEDEGTQSDQTWEDYLQANPRVASVA
ncbi:hypothetical protein Sste5346_001801 [Sporothrix stenoceras]|uniref:DUF7514 domain-containing protein n=1 Tax=Sporothrix stenoceras TaxID=5173 RepID=A0ABR3ZL54_9PEZI